MSEQATDRPVRLIFRFPFKRPADFHAPQIEAANEWTVEERVWRCLLSLPGPDRPQDILAELEQDQVTFDWELLAETLNEPLSVVFEAASSLFRQHMGRPLELVEESIQFTGVRQQQQQQQQSTVSNGSIDHEEASDGGESQGRVPASSMGNESSREPASPLLDSPASSQGLERAGLRSVESVGDGLAGDEPGSPAVELSIATPRGGGSSRQQSGDEDGPPEKPEVPARVGSGAQIQARRSVEPRLTRRLRDSSRRGRAVEESEVNMRQSMLADAIGSQFLPDRASRGPAGGGDRPPTAPASTAAASAPAERKLSSLSSSSSFSDLSSSSLTESAMQDALISEAMAASTTMSSLLGSRMFPWSKKR